MLYYLGRSVSVLGQNSILMRREMGQVLNYQFSFLALYELINLVLPKPPLTTDFESRDLSISAESPNGILMQSQCLRDFLYSISL